MARTVIDEVVRKTLHKQGKDSEYFDLQLKWGEEKVAENTQKVTIEKSEYGIPELQQFEPLNKVYQQVKVADNVTMCQVEFDLGEGIVKEYEVPAKAFCLVKTLALAQVSASDLYSDAISRVFVQFLPQVLKGVEKFVFTEDPEWSYLMKKFFRYGVDYVCLMLGQQSCVWEVLDEDTGNEEVMTDESL